MNPYQIVAHARYSLHRECPKTGWKIETRALVDHELVLVTGGRGKVVIEGSDFSLMPGTMLYFPPGLRHSMFSCNDNPLSFYGVHFSYLSVDFFSDEWKCEGGKEVLPVRNIFETAAYQKMELLFERLNRCWNEKGLGYEMICRSILLEILCQCLCCDEINYASRKKIETLMGFIHKNLERKITVGEMAKMVDLSPDYLSVQFKCITGFTIVQYLNRSRIDRAKVLLLDEKMKIGDAAEKLGFCDEFYFSRVFKKYEGVSPANYVKRENLSSFSE